MSRCYLLDGHKVVAATVETWSRWFQTCALEDRQVGFHKTGEMVVSTVFLGLDHSFRDHVPLVFETMVFNGPLEGHGERYATWQDAASGHSRWTQEVQKIAQEHR